MLNWVVDQVYYMAQCQKQIWILGGIPIVATSRDEEDIPSIEDNISNANSVENETGELDQ